MCSFSAVCGVSKSCEVTKQDEDFNPVSFPMCTSVSLHICSPSSSSFSLRKASFHKVQNLCPPLHIDHFPLLKTLVPSLLE